MTALVSNNGVLLDVPVDERGLRLRTKLVDVQLASFFPDFVVVRRAGDGRIDKLLRVYAANHRIGATVGVPKLIDNFVDALGSEAGEAKTDVLVLAKLTDVAGD